MTNEGESFLGISGEKDATPDTEYDYDQGQFHPKAPEKNRLKGMGLFLITTGFVLGMFFLFIFSTTVEKVNNIGLLNTKLAGVIASVGIAVMGSIFYTGGIIASKIK